MKSIIALHKNLCQWSPKYEKKKNMDSFEHTVVFRYSFKYSFKLAYLCIVDR